MRRAILLLALVVSTSAWADGVPLFVLTERGSFFSSNSAPDFNRSAFASKVVTATFDGRRYRFNKAQQAAPEGYEVWFGRSEGDAATLTLSRIANGPHVLGQALIGTRHFLFNHSPKVPLNYRTITTDPNTAAAIYSTAPEMDLSP